MNNIREKVISDIDELWSYVCFIRYRFGRKYPLEELYYMNVLYEYLLMVITDFEKTGVKPNQLLLDTIRDGVDNFNEESLPICKENMTRENKCNLFFNNYDKYKELSVTLKGVIEKDHKLYSYKLHNKVYIMYKFLHEEVDDIIVLMKAYNTVFDKLIDIMPKCEKIFA